MANRNFASGGKIYSMHVKPVLVDCNFVVDSTNGNGLGIRSLKGPLVQNVYMQSTSAPSTRPNPGPGTIVVQLQDNYSRSYCGFNAIVSPVSGSAIKIDNSALTAGIPYTIVTLGDATAAAWHALGVPAGVTPAQGVSFVAQSVGAGANTSTSRVMASSSSGVISIETIGDPNLSIAPSPQANQGFGAQFILQCSDSSGAAVAPAPGSVISLAFYLGDSSVMVQGE